MAAKLTRLTHKIAIQLHLVAESYTICSSRSRRPVRKLFIQPCMCVTEREREEYMDFTCPLLFKSGLFECHLTATVEICLNRSKASVA
jgi:hypothetical protein